jgi:hypothetical protein
VVKIKKLICMKKILIAITGLFLITSLIINAQAQQKTTTKNKMSCCMNKGTMTIADSSKCKAGKCDTSKCKTSCTNMKTGMKNCDPAKCSTMTKK